MTATTTESLPVGWKLPAWSSSNWDARVTAIRLLPRRVRVLLASEWARSVLPLFEDQYPRDPRPRAAIEAAERWVVVPNADAADAYAYAAAAAAAAAYAYADAAYAAYAAAAAAAAANAYADAAVYAADAAVYAANAADATQTKWQWLYATYRHARGPSGLWFNPAWLTTTAVALARGIFDGLAFDRMPYLADAIQDAGCDNAELLTHLQGSHDEFTRADWVLTNLLNYHC